ncbi:MAG TPA: ABC transporter ATP-binding protein [Acidilobales archaeon]|nr:ABC transporter ATP-binding protein [Acidilobales archaeon]
MPNSILSLNNVNAGYGKFQVLFNISMEANNNEITVIVGPNGSGKSTLLKTIFGFTSIYSGKVAFKGIDITSKKPHEIAKLGIAYLPQLENTFLNLTVRENILLATYIHEGETMDIEDALSLFPQLKSLLERKASTLSGGERQMLAMTMALLRKPSLMLLDEPTANMAPKIAKLIFEKIIELRDNYNIAVILVEQNAKKALEIGDKAYLLVAGKKIFEGHPQDLLKKPDLTRVYLGIS